MLASSLHGVSNQLIEMNAPTEDWASRPASGSGSVARTVQDVLDLQVRRRLDQCWPLTHEGLQHNMQLECQVVWESGLRNRQGHGASERQPCDQAKVASALAQSVLTDADADAVSEHAVQLSRLTGQVRYVAVRARLHTAQCTLGG